LKKKIEELEENREKQFDEYKNLRGSRSFAFAIVGIIIYCILAPSAFINGATLVIAGLLTATINGYILMPEKILSDF